MKYSFSACVDHLGIFRKNGNVTEPFSVWVLLLPAVLTIWC